MRIGNPPPVQQSTIAVSGVASPQTMVTLATVSLSSATSTDIAPLTDQCEIVISNISTTGVGYVRDTLAATGGQGTPIYPQGFASLTLNQAVRLTNNSGVTINFAVNQIAKGP
jgi:hypothetical protein